MGLYYLPFRFSTNRNKQITRQNKLKANLKQKQLSLSEYGKLAKDAEYHLNTGLDPWEIRNELIKIGFKNVQVFFHFENGKKLKKTITFYENIKILIKILLKFNFANLNKKLYELSPVFAIIAQKK
jgi:hypothetical protein